MRTTSDTLGETGPRLNPGPRQPPATSEATPGPVLDLVVPVFNEADALTNSVDRLRAHLDSQFPFTWRITIVDNGSTDATAAVATHLAALHSDVEFIHLDTKGRGLALRTAWTRSDADVVAYTDVDLSTGLDALLPLVAPLLSGHSDVAIGSRLAGGALVARGPKREAISRTYNLILRTAFATRVHDAQCGFKALRADAARALLPEIEDDAWFFDTELLLLAEHHGLRIHEVPVDWIDDPDSRVMVTRTAIDDLRGVARMAHRFMTGTPTIDYDRPALDDDMGRSLVSFTLIGAASTAISASVFMATREAVGPVPANVLALTATAGANTWANSRYTLGRRDTTDRRLHYLTGGAIWLGGVVASSTALRLVDAAGGDERAQLTALAGTWSATSLARFALWRRRPLRRPAAQALPPVDGSHAGSPRNHPPVTVPVPVPTEDR